MAVARTETLAIRAEADILTVRHTVRKWATALGFGIVDQTKLTTAASELARNALVHGKGGLAIVEEVREPGRVGIRMTFEDRGPGIPDVALALEDGYTTGGGLGLGLGGSKRLMQEFAIATRVGEGTRVTIGHFKPA